MTIGKSSQPVTRLATGQITPGLGVAGGAPDAASSYGAGSRAPLGAGAPSPWGPRMDVQQLPGLPPTPIAPELIRARYCLTSDLNVTNIPSQTGAVVSESAGWKSLGYLDRPTCFVPLVQLKRSVVYAPNRQPNASYANQAQFAGCVKAVGPGVIYCWAPGEWWVNYTHPANGAPHVAPFVQVSCEDPAVAVALMSMPGCQRWNSGSANTSAAAGTVTTVLPANRFRTSLSVSQVAASTIFFDFGKDPIATAGAEQGIPLQAGGYATLEDQMNNRDDFRAVAAAASVHFQYIETE